MKKYLILIIIFITPFRGASAHNENNLFIDKFLIDLYLIYKFPITKKILIGNLTLSKPLLSLNEKNQQVTLKLNYSIDLNKNALKGDFLASSSISYDEKDKLIKIHKTTIGNIKFLEKEIDKESLGLINAVLIQGLDNFTIYKIEKNTLFGGIEPKKIVIIDDGILINY